jgi:uncharacterized protein (TIGR02145 family)
MKRIVLYCVIAAALAAAVATIIVLNFKTQWRSDDFDGRVTAQVENVPYDRLELMLDGVNVGYYYNGTLHITLPDTLPSEFLNGFRNLTGRFRESRHVYIDDKYNDAVFFEVDRIQAFSDGAQIGSFDQFNIDLEIDAYFWYVDRDVKIEYFHNAATKGWNLEEHEHINMLKKGWNKVYKAPNVVHMSYKDTVMGYNYVLCSPDGGVKWVFNSIGGEDGDECGDCCGDCGEEFWGDAEEEDDIAIDYGSLTDSRDGKVYKTVKIGEQVWMAENLNYKTDNSWCYEDNEANCGKYGRLYVWEAAEKACPLRWHLSTEQEWNTLVAAVGGDVAGKKLKAKSGWNENGNGTDEFGFSALPGGNRYYGESFHDAGKSGYWWTTTEIKSGNAYIQYMNHSENMSGHGDSKSNGYSVRCVRN